jgi:hypothetical protein
VRRNVRALIDGRRVFGTVHAQRQPTEDAPWEVYIEYWAAPGRLHAAWFIADKDHMTELP